MDRKDRNPPVKENLHIRSSEKGQSKEMRRISVQIHDYIRRFCAWHLYNVHVRVEILYEQRTTKNLVRSTLYYYYYGLNLMRMGGGRAQTNVETMYEAYCFRHQ